MLYRRFATQEELDAQYDLRALIPEAAAAYERFCEEESEDLRAELEHSLDVPFGPTLAERLDIYPAPGAEGPAPVLIYVHGGYWVLRTSREFGFVARGPSSRGVATVVVNYALAPAVSVTEILRQVRAAVAWVYRNAASFGGDPRRIHVAGHSAGGHLAAMLLSTDWEGVYGLPPDVVKGATVISGLFDLSPFPYTFLQPKLQLSWREVLECSPALNLPEAGAYAPPLVVAYGGRETEEFRRQSEEFFGAWKGGGLPGELLLLDDNDHFDILHGFLDSESALCSAVLGGMGVR